MANTTYPAKNKVLYYNQVMKSLAASGPEQAYLLFGSEILLAENLINFIKEKFLQKADKEINFFVRYATDNSVDEIISLGSGLGLFSDKKLILLREVQALKKDDIKRLVKFLGKLPPEICVILQTNVPTLYQTRLKEVQDVIPSVNLLPLRDFELRDFIKSEFIKQGKQISEEGSDMLLFLVGTQMSDLIGQINNIAHYFTDKAALDIEDIEKIASVYVTQDVFEYNKYMASRKLKNSLFVLNNLLDSGISPLQIVAQLQRHFSILWRINGLQISGVRDKNRIGKELNIYSRYYDEYASQARNWNSKQLKQVFSFLHDVDYKLKDSNSDSKNILDLLSYEIINC